ncbi:Endoplasmic reticulum-golgi intermediate compartment protein, putative [Pediculus humanus corporis]|uniref:Endoplasmic reticulum-golgi intermediate compartment protein, putative n=1 Tax=Pediculus humanus subsp. corporis TaxID=121224 RepID=E0VCV5_PEDHC|nr:Endoplasmic reticulum-golgi intermediate compartment protein, putative [Pediculus humanus corporis]EEB11211.1 Endoplasmic reticulum-golgi intermediate compartment protein, putative [Pediculus humanus corporis]
MVLRQRFKKVVSLKSVKVLDAFPKVDNSCRESSPVGGTLSIISYILMLWILYSEITYYTNSKITYKFLPDVDFDQKVKIYLDMTVAMPCSAVSADILDSTQQSVFNFGELHEENTWFDLEPSQKINFDQIKNVNALLRQDYHEVHEYLWKSASPSFINVYVPRKNLPNRPYDACRIYGELVLNKVAGNFHISAGKSLQLPRGHIHIATFMSDKEFNFSHRLNYFSFGDYSPGIVHPLEGDEKIATDAMMSYQYFIEVVPTEVKTFLTNQLTYQYSVKDYQRPINHNTGSHGIPGIFFKYDMSALKVIVMQERDSPINFAVKLCASIGGIHITSGLVNNIILYLINFYKK